ncbi:GntR family transcriptional regulator [Micromonospora carbonacea]|uniref:Winged helix-turn-helix transcriptional regulator n=1 Tax=Micromonospora carbonacea TaxID=47853 RepID=A0A7H8XPW4_9ACTN|nr:winged helix-turn-helix domain-containing protein [Micromonospora carbonacea]MBB5826199.1 DNA-binding GntR family transcriptional regulator [Micromonospora carbonacea]QLD25751.1 winged helix-turn-helix transcriptional regulator [Micromonospora carbonacea]
MVDEMSPLAFNVQPAVLLAKELEAGRLNPRQPLPSESHLQQQYGGSRGTVRAAIRALRDRGMVVTFTGRGNYVVDRP